MSSEHIAVVTGANKGIGFSIVKGLCEKFKGKVYLTSRNETLGREAVEKLNRLGLKPQYHSLDIANIDSIKTFTAYISQKYKQINILVNNAAILFTKDSTVPHVQQVIETMYVNYFTSVEFCENMLKLVKDNGRIVNISSSSGHLSRIPSEELRNRLGSPDITLKELNLLMKEYLDSAKKCTDLQDGWGDSPYVVSKVGMTAYTFLLQRRLMDRGIKVNCVHPGYVASDMTNKIGNLTPGEGARVPLYLALEAPDTVKGEFLWHNRATVDWYGPDPRISIDNK